ncbi:MAG: Gfo/Idh/MocA family protein [Planctomycetota bacterium]|jgi:predicted dehydrogenase
MKVVICGGGAMGRAHLETFSAIDGARVVAVAEPESTKAGFFGERGIRTFADGGEMLQSVNADLAVVATPTAFHAPLAISALERGMHVFCEKPMARSLEDGRAMVRAAEKAGRTLGIGYALRFHDAYMLARDYIQSGKLGRTGTVRTSRCAQKAGSWTADLEANGGVTFELLTHDLDWLSWSLGPVKRIFARGLARGKKQVERDYALAVVRFEDGTVAHLEGSLAEAQEFYASYEVAGSEGLISYDTRRSTVLEGRFITAEGLEGVSEAPQKKRPLARQIAAFVRAIETGDAYEVSGGEGLKSLALTVAAYQSIQSGEPVEI